MTASAAAGARTAALVLCVVMLLPGRDADAGVLKVKEVFQEQSQWCWSAVSQAILDYYGHTVSQCSIAEYTRKNATWHNFGKVDCCLDATKGCNYWNYLDIYSGGGVDDILKAFGNLPTKGVGGQMSKTQVAQEIDTGARPFVARWSWNSGGGHFVVVNGLTNDMLSYMNPWKGEGQKTAKFDWFRKGSTHTWTSNLTLTTSCRCTKASACCDGCQLKNQGKSCNDGDLCTTGDTCQGSMCVGTALDCGPAASCARRGQCNPLTGKCEYSQPPDGTSCDDGDLCTTGDACKAGTCAGKSVSCKGASACQKAGTCNPSTGLCEHVSLPDGTPCNDQDPCTVKDGCKGGACRGSVRSCPPPGACQQPGRCNRTTGQCEYGFLPDAASCDDGNPCTLMDQCTQGICAGALTRPCLSRVCHYPGTCNPASGACEYLPLPDGSPCAEGICTAGVCQRPAPDGGAGGGDQGSDTSGTPAQHPGGCQMTASRTPGACTWLLAALWLYGVRRRRRPRTRLNP